MGLQSAVATEGMTDTSMEPSTAARPEGVGGGAVAAVVAEGGGGVAMGEATAWSGGSGGSRPTHPPPPPPFATPCTGRCHTTLHGA